LGHFLPLASAASAGCAARSQCNAKGNGDRTGDLDLEKVAERCGPRGRALGFEDLYAEVIDATKLLLKRANFCRVRLAIFLAS
jgi:hypothetical protein